VIKKQEAKKEKLVGGNRRNGLGSGIKKMKILPSHHYQHA
jgi:hypothetical protein